MRILVVDDHDIVRRGLRELLAEEFPNAQVDEKRSAEEVMESVQQRAYDLVVLDISLPGRGGLDVLKELHAQEPDLRVLVLSQHAEEDYAVRALRAGAKAYLSKRSASEELVRAVRKVLGGGTYVSESLAVRLAESLQVDRTRPIHEALSDRELQVLRLIANGKAVKEIAAELSLSEKTVSTYRTRILEKLDMKGNAELMRYALRAGLVE